MTVGSVFPQLFSRRLAAAAFLVWLSVPAAIARAQEPAAGPAVQPAAQGDLGEPRPSRIEGPAADRMVAEWMLRMGGSVVLEGQRKPITDLADLPTTDFRIHTLNFTGITMYAASLQDELKRLPPLPHLKELYINGRLWYDQPAPRVQATISLFNQSTELEKFVMSKPVQTYIPFNDPALKGLTALTNLKEVRIHQTRSSGVSLGAFPLTHLDLNYAVTFNDTGMASLKGKTTLQRLYLRGTSITDAGLQNLSDLTNLVELDLSDVAMTDVGLSSLSGLTKLRRLNLQSADVTDAGTDDKVGVSLNDTWWGNFTGLSYSHDDLERNSTFKYDLGFRNLGALHDIANVTIKKYGSDGLCLRSFQLLLDEVSVFSRTFGNTSSTCRWLDGSSETTGQFHVSHAELRATPAFVNWQPAGSLFVPQEEIEERLEGIMGSLIWNNDDVKWGKIYGEAVSVSAHPTLAQEIVVDYDLEGVGFGPNPEVDIDLHLRVEFLPAGGGWQLSFASTYFAANVDFSWWAEVIISLGTIVCGPVTGQDCVGLLEDHIEEQIEASFGGFSQAFDVETGPCPSPQVDVTSDGSLEFFCQF